jgi:hypothetical protein
MPPALAEPFWPKVDTTAGALECWPWLGTMKGNGYGMLVVRRVKHLAHRFAYELLVGPIPAGLQLDHLCRNRRCVNPAHLEPVTARENTIRGKALITACPRGHAYTPENTDVRRNGHRSCRECRLAARRASYQPRPRALATRCGRGHDLTAFRSRTRSGHTYCRECHRLGEMRRRTLAA